MSKRVNDLNRKYLIESSIKYKKIDNLNMGSEEYKMKDYFLELDLTSARMKFQERAQMVKSCSSHFPSSKSFLQGGFFCPCHKDGKDREKMVENLFHCKKCLRFSKYRESNNIETEIGLTKYYLQIIKARAREASD